MRAALQIVGLLVLLAQAFLFGYLIGAGHGADMVRRDAVAEGYAVREGDDGFRWKRSAELERRPEKRSTK